MTRPSPVKGEIQKHVHEPYGNLRVIVKKEDGTEWVENYELKSVEKIEE